jgi:hypothetical protein
MLLNNIRDRLKDIRLPKQKGLPRLDQLVAIYNDSVRSPGKTIELPLGQNRILIVTRKTNGTCCNWSMRIWQDSTATIEFEQDSNDPRWVHQQLAEYFPKYNPNRK